MPRVIIYTVMVLLMIALVPPVVIARVRSTPSEKRPIHIVQDMDIQPKFKTQVRNPLFADSRAMRPEMVGAVARGETYLDPHLNDGVVDGDWATMLPASIDVCLLYTSPSPRDPKTSRMPSSA